MASAWKGGGRKLPQGKVEYEVNARNGERLKHSHQFLSSPLITDVASSMLIAIKANNIFDDTFTLRTLFCFKAELLLKFLSSKHY